MVRSLIIKPCFVLTKKVNFMTTPIKSLPAELGLLKLPLNVEIDFEMTEETEEWVKNILLEMNENATDKTPAENLEETYLHISGQMTKKFTSENGEYLLMSVRIQTEYNTECVRTLKPMSESMDLEFNVCFINETLATSELFAEIDETYLDGAVYEIYFYNKKTANIQEMVHEQIYLNYNQYPILDAESDIPGAAAEEPTKQ